MSTKTINDPVFKVPTLTKLEQFVWDNQEQNVHSLAGQTNRTESAIQAAFSRADRKLKEIAAIKSRAEKSTTGIVVNVEKSSPRAEALAEAIRKANPTTREAVREIAWDHTFAVHVGGRHVAISTVSGGEREIIVTHQTAPDFN